MSIRERTIVLADTGTAPPGRGQGRLAVVGATVLVVVIALGVMAMFAGGGGAGTDKPPTQVQTQTPSTSSVPTGGFARAEAGATDAAVSYLAAFADPRMYDESYRSRTLQRLLDPDVADELSEQLGEAYERAASTLGLGADGRPASGTLVSRVAPMGVDVVAYDQDRAVVAVWTAAVTGVAGDASPYPVQTTFSTSTVTVVWSGGTWRWNAVSSVDGPVPAGSPQVPSTAAALAAAQQRFAPYGASDGG